MTPNLRPINSGIRNARRPNFMPRQNQWDTRSYPWQRRGEFLRSGWGPSIQSGSHSFASNSPPCYFTAWKARSYAFSPQIRGLIETCGVSAERSRPPTPPLHPPRRPEKAKRLRCRLQPPRYSTALGIAIPQHEYFWRVTSQAGSCKGDCSDVSQRRSAY